MRKSLTLRKRLFMGMAVVLLAVASVTVSAMDTAEAECIKEDRKNPLSPCRTPIPEVVDVTLSMRYSGNPYRKCTPELAITFTDPIPEPFFMKQYGSHQDTGFSPEVWVQEGSTYTSSGEWTRWKSLHNPETPAHVSTLYENLTRYGGGQHQLYIRVSPERGEAYSASPTILDHSVPGGLQNLSLLTGIEQLYACQERASRDADRAAEWRAAEVIRITAESILESIEAELMDLRRDHIELLAAWTEALNQQTARIAAERAVLMETATKLLERREMVANWYAEQAELQSGHVERMTTILGQLDLAHRALEAKQRVLAESIAELDSLVDAARVEEANLLRQLQEAEEAGETTQ